MSRNIFIFSLLFICIDLVSAETLTEVEVNSPMFTNSINENKYPIHIIQNEEISRSKSLGDNLKELSGMTNADYGAAVGQPSIRGLTGNRTKILSNGMTVNDLSSLSADHINNVDLNNISHIAVSKPPSEISCAAVKSFLSFNFNNISITFFSCFRLTGGGAASITLLVTS